MEYTKDQDKDTTYVSVNTLVQPKKYDSANDGGKENLTKTKPGLLDQVYSKGLTGTAWVIEKIPSFNFVPVSGFGFMQNFFKGIMVGSIERLSGEKVEHLWQIIQNVAKAVTSIDYMKAYFWGFLKGFFGDFLMIWELPGTIKSTVNFIENLISKIKEFSKDDLQEFAGRIEEIKSYIIEEGSAYINNILQDIKAGKSSELIIETLKTMTNFTQDTGKSVGNQLTGVMLEYFSKDYKELGKELGGFMGEVSGTVAFTALLAAITAGVGTVWGGVRAGIKTVAEIIGKGVGQTVKAIGTVCKSIAKIFETFIDGARAVIKGFGNGASKLFKGIKGKLDEVLVKVKGLIDDVVEKLAAKVSSKYYTKAGEPIWPKNDGFAGKSQTQMLSKHTIVDRYGYENGTFVSPAGTPFEKRALPASYVDTKPLKTYEVIKPVEVQAGEIEPWFDQPGKGIQYKFNKSIQELLDEGILREVIIKSGGGL